MAGARSGWIIPAKERSTMAYTKQFKEEAIKLVTGPEGYSKTAAARQLGIPQSTLAKWLEQGGLAAAGQDRPDAGGGDAPG
jgi:transposase-like protein